MPRNTSLGPTRAFDTDIDLRLGKSEPSTLLVSYVDSESSIGEDDPDLRRSGEPSRIGVNLDGTVNVTYHAGPILLSFQFSTTSHALRSVSLIGRQH